MCSSSVAFSSSEKASYRLFVICYLLRNGGARPCGTRSSNRCRNAQITTFEDFACWKKCRELRLFVAKEAIPALPKEERYRLGEQLLRAARSTTANIAEGYGRFHYLDNAKFCSNSRGSCWEVLDQVIQDFPARSTRIAAKFCVIEVMKPSVSFGDISRCGARRAQQLFSQAISLLLGQAGIASFATKRRSSRHFSNRLNLRRS